MTYKLPTKDGAVDFEDLADDLREIDLGRGYGASPSIEIERDEFVAILKAIDAHARAEERERCAKVADAEIKKAVLSKKTMIIPNVGIAIRALGDEK